MAEDGIVGPYAGSQAREVLLTVADWEKMQGYETEADPDPSPSHKRRSNKVRLRNEDGDAIDAEEYAEYEEYEEDDEIPFEDDDHEEYYARSS